MDVEHCGTAAGDHQHSLPTHIDSYKPVLLLCGLSVALAGTLFAIGCQTAPVTERRQLLVMSEEKENAMGLTAYQQVLDEEPVTSNTAATEMVREIGRRIAAVANRPDFEWDFNVIEAKTQNAFCLPGGKVAVYTGILPVCQNEAGLAAAGFRTFAPPDGAFYVYADVSDLTDDSLALSREILDKAGVAVTPGLDFDPDRGHATIRFSFAGSTEDMVEACKRMKAWIKR